MKSVTIMTWAIALIGIAILSFAPISPEDLPEGVIRQGFRVGHAPAYGLLAVLTLHVLRVTDLSKGFTQSVLVSAAAVILLGGAIELLQPYFGRSASLHDFVLNTIGVTVALVLLLAIRGWMSGRRTARQLPTSD